MTPDWKLPAGVDRGLWDYVNNPALARGYEAHLATSPLAAADLEFAARHFARPGAVIDLGCGTGRLLARLGPAYRRFGTDLSPEMLRVAAERVAGVAWVRCNLTDLASFRDGSFEYAACLFSTYGMIRGADHRRRFLAEAARILAPGGVLVLHAHNRHYSLWSGGRPWWLRDQLRGLTGHPGFGERTMPQHHGGAPLTLRHFSRAELADDLNAAGFELVEVVPVGLGLNGSLPRPWLFPAVRSNGWLAAARVRGGRTP